MTTSREPPRDNTGIFQGVTFYHWLVVIIASCGWLFDCMDQRLFTMARLSALKELLGSDAKAQAVIEQYLTYATAAMMLGWGAGGIIFGMMSDKWGRVKTMLVTLLVYSSFTGLSGLAHGWFDFTIYRFLVGLGVGGMFGAATSLVAESVPGHFRTLALGSLQALSAVGNLIASTISLSIPPGAETVSLFGHVLGHSGWRILFFVGVLPALLVVPIVFFLKEPEAWKRAKEEARNRPEKKRVGSLADLFRDPRWRRNTLVGLGLGVSGMVGLWGIGYFSPELITAALKTTPIYATDVRVPQLAATLQSPTNAAAILIQGHLSPEMRAKLTAPLQETGAGLAEAIAEEFNRIIQGASLYDARVFSGLSKKVVTLAEQVSKSANRADTIYLNRQLIEAAFPNQITRIGSYIDRVRSKAMMLYDVGALAGMFGFTFLAASLNRRKAFAIAFVLCLGITAFVFYSLKSETDAYWMLPLMGFAQLAVFAGYSIYFPELYPTRLRGTGVGFCYNTVRFATVPLLLAMGHLSANLGLRNAGAIMSGIYLIGLITLIWAVETKGKPLPED